MIFAGRVEVEVYPVLNYSQATSVTGSSWISRATISSREQSSRFHLAHTESPLFFSLLGTKTLESAQQDCNGSSIKQW